MEDNYFVHEASYVGEPRSIGPGTKIWHFSHVMKNSRIGQKCNIGQNVVISPGVTVHLQPCHKFLRHQKGDFPASEKLAQESLALPVHPALGTEDLEYVCESIRVFTA